MPSLLSLPAEVLQNIAFTLIAAAPLGPPSQLVPLLLVSSHFHALLNANDNPALYARIARFKFDLAPVTRRAFVPSAVDAAVHLQQTCVSLASIRAADMDSPDVEDNLAVIFILLLHNDGKNRAQLAHVFAFDYVDRFIRSHLRDSSEQRQGWPLDSTINALALWNLWLLTTKDYLLSEPRGSREQIISLLLPFVLVHFRYSSAYAPPLYFSLPKRQTPTILTPHGHYPLYPSGLLSVFYLRSRPPINVPPAAIAAKLLYFARREVVPMAIPNHLPASRTEARQRGIFFVSPTQEDIREIIGHDSARTPPCVTWDWVRGCAVMLSDGPAKYQYQDNVGDEFEKSRRWDADWWRMRLCTSVLTAQPRWKPGYVYVPGTLTGLWQGRHLVPSEFNVSALFSTPIFPESGITERGLMVTSRPMFMRLEEHACYFPAQSDELVTSPTRPVPVAENGSLNAWFPGPKGKLRWEKDILSGNDGVPKRIRVYEPGTSGTTYVYETIEIGKDLSSRGRYHSQRTCSKCQEREAVLKRIRAEDYEDTALVMSGDRPRRDEVDDKMEDENEDEAELELEGDDLPFGEPEQMTEDGVKIESTRRIHDRHKIPICNGVQDIVLTGKTDDRHAQAWEYYEYYGRVRLWDGMIGILRRSTLASLDYMFFYGYLVGPDTFVGNWRVGNQNFDTNPLAPAWESAFVMSRRHDN